MNYFKTGHLYEDKSTNTIILITRERDDDHPGSAEAFTVCSTARCYSNGPDRRIEINEFYERKYFTKITPEKLLSL